MSRGSVGGQAALPAKPADDEARTRPRGQAGGERVEVAAGVADVVGGRVAGALAQAPHGGRPERAGGRVEVGLVADLEALEPRRRGGAGPRGRGRARCRSSPSWRFSPIVTGASRPRARPASAASVGRVDVVPHAGRARAAVRRVPPRLLARRPADPQRQRRAARRPRAAAAARRSPAAPARRTARRSSTPSRGRGTARARRARARRCRPRPAPGRPARRRTAPRRPRRARARPPRSRSPSPARARRAQSSRTGQEPSQSSSPGTTIAARRGGSASQVPLSEPTSVASHSPSPAGRSSRCRRDTVGCSRRRRSGGCARRASGRRRAARPRTAAAAKRRDRPRRATPGAATTARRHVGDDPAQLGHRARGERLLDAPLERVDAHVALCAAAPQDGEGLLTVTIGRAHRRADSAPRAAVSGKSGRP